MKKIIYLTIICISVIGFGSTDFIPLSNTDSVVHAERQTPAYAKWGKLIVEKTKEKYPDAQVVDFLHVGKEDIGSNAVEKFRLRLKGPDKEFVVFVDVEFNKTSEKSSRFLLKKWQGENNTKQHIEQFIRPLNVLFIRAKLPIVL